MLPLIYVGEKEGTVTTSRHGQQRQKTTPGAIPILQKNLYIPVDLPDKMDDASNEGLELLVEYFGEVFFRLGTFANNKDYSPDRISEALDDYRTSRKKYKGDTSVYNKHINDVLITFPDLDSIPRV